jgi:hypothetical protein
MYNCGLLSYRKVAGGGILPLLRQRLASPQDIFYTNIGTLRQGLTNVLLRAPPSAAHRLMTSRFFLCCGSPSHFLETLLNQHLHCEPFYQKLPKTHVVLCCTVLLQVAGGGILPLLRQRLASPQDIFYINTGTWHRKTAEWASAYQPDLQALGQYYIDTKKDWPHMLFRETPAIHPADLARNVCMPLDGERKALVASGLMRLCWCIMQGHCARSKVKPACGHQPTSCSLS